MCFEPREKELFTRDGLWYKKELLGVKIKYLFWIEEREIYYFV